MIVVGGKNQIGHVLHVIVGPESEFYMDVHGAKVLELTPLLMAMNGAERIFLSFTRCRSEQLTTQLMNASQVPHLNSFGTSTPATDKDAAAETPSGDNAVAPKTAKPKPKCSYCSGDNMPLLPIPGFKICAECAQIELGRMKKITADKQAADKPAADTAPGTIGV